MSEVLILGYKAKEQIEAPVIVPSSEEAPDD